MQRRRLSKFGAVRLSRIEAINIIRMKKKAFNFFATDLHLSFFLEYGNDHLAKIFDRLQKRLNNNIIVPIDTLLNDINTRTKANIIHTILGLGQICRQQQHSELADMPDIVHFLEQELRELNTDDFTHRTRGQHP
eukprot:6375443-Heterocapsa_arctica.AAC.1